MIDDEALADLKNESEALDEEFGDPQQEKIEALARERDELKDQLMRTLADMQNLRRRHQQERDDFRRFATESLVQDIIPVLDNFDRTLAAYAGGASVEALIEGVKLVDRQLRTALESVKLKRMDVVGQPFDPEHHEAIALEASTEHEPGTVIEELSAGYKMDAKVVRPARVKVSKAP